MTGTRFLWAILIALGIGCAALGAWLALRERKGLPAVA